MPRCETFRVILQPSIYINGGEGGVEFIRIEVSNFSGDCLQTNYSTEVGRRAAIYVQRSINESFKWLGINSPFYDTGVDWTDNILVPNIRWGDRVRVGDWDWGNQPGVIIRYDVPWRSVVPARTAYLPRIPPENARGTARRVCDTHLWENRLARAQKVLYAHNQGSIVPRIKDYFGINYCYYLKKRIEYIFCFEKTKSRRINI